MSEKLQQNSVGATKAQKNQQKTGKGNNMQNQQKQNKAKANNVQKAKQKPVKGNNQQKVQQKPGKGNNVHQKPNQKNMPKQHHAQPANAHQKSAQNTGPEQQKIQTQELSSPAKAIYTTPLSPIAQMEARYNITDCFEKLWSSKKSVNVIAVSFTVKDSIQKLERDRAIKSILGKIQVSINQNIGRTKCFWIRRNQASFTVNIPLYTAIFMNNLNPDTHPWKNYSSIIRRYFLQNADACCNSIQVHTPPGYSTPKFMEISERLNNYATGENWVNELTEDLDPGFVIVKFGLIFEKFPKNSRKFLKSSAGASARK